MRNETAASEIPPWYCSTLVCPRDHGALMRTGSTQLRCANGHTYPVVDGIPVMLLDDVPQTAWWVGESIREAHSLIEQNYVSPEPVDGRVDAWVQDQISQTSGYLYKPLVGKLKEYPIPEIRLPQREGGELLDIGCNWGRWVVAAGRKGYRPIGIDPCM